MGYERINVTSCYKMYNVGYNLGPYDDLKFIKNRSLCVIGLMESSY